MRKLMTLTLLLGTGLATTAIQAEPPRGDHHHIRDDRDASIRTLRQEINRLMDITYRRHHISDGEIREALDLVLDAQDTLRGRRFLEVCQNSSNIDELKFATDTIKNLADDHLAMGSYDASIYARQWTKEYPCSAARSFAKVAKELKETADNYFAMGSYDASIFAKEHTPKVCSLRKAAEIPEQARKLQNYADTSLGMGSYDASIWAKKRILKEYLLCADGDVFKFGIGRGHDDGRRGGRGHR